MLGLPAPQMIPGDKPVPLEPATPPTVPPATNLVTTPDTSLLGSAPTLVVVAPTLPSTPPAPPRMEYHFQDANGADRTVDLNNLTQADLDRLLNAGLLDHRAPQSNMERDVYSIVVGGQRYAVIYYPDLRGSEGNFPLTMLRRWATAIAF